MQEEVGECLHSSVFLISRGAVAVKGYVYHANRTHAADTYREEGKKKKVKAFKCPLIKGC